MTSSARSLVDSRTTGAADSVLVGLQPPGRHHAPPVTGMQPRELPLRPGRDEVIADGNLVLEELPGHHRAYGMQTDILGSDPAIGVAVEAGDRVVSARRQCGAADVSLGHAFSLAETARSGRR